MNRAGLPDAIFIRRCASQTFDNQMFVDDFRPRKRALRPLRLQGPDSGTAKRSRIHCASSARDRDLFLIHCFPCHPQRSQTTGRFKVGDKIRVNLHHGKIEDAVVRAVIQDDDRIKLQVDVVGLDLTVLIDTRQVVE